MSNKRSLKKVKEFNLEDEEQVDDYELYVEYKCCDSFVLVNDYGGKCPTCKKEYMLVVQLWSKE